MNKIIHMKIPMNGATLTIPVETVLKFIDISREILGDEYKLIATPFDTECIDGDAKVIDCKAYSCNELKEIIDRSEDKMFTKADLKTGDFVVREDGEVEVVLVEYNAMVCQHGGFNTLTGLNINDIAKIYRPRDNRNCSFNNYKNGFIIYERSEEVEMTIEEISKALGKKVKVVG